MGKIDETTKGQDDSHESEDDNDVAVETGIK